MDRLKQLIALKKPKQKLTIQKNLIDQQKQQFLKAQQQGKKQKQIQQQKKLSQISQFYGKPRKLVKTQIQQPPLSVQEVKQQLRKLYQPATMFGQTPHRRYQRLLKAKKFHQNHPNQDMKLYDEQFVKKVKENQEYEELDAKYRELLIQPKILGDPITRAKKQQMIQKQQKPSFAEMCDLIHLWIIKILKGWGETLQQNYRNQLNKETNKYQLYQQTTAEIRTFFPVLKQRNGDHDMIQSIYYIMNCCLIRQYVQANTRYIELSIGNAPWPMGVAMLGITVRKNTERLSYVLDNQITRKWILGFKRLITVSQELYPNQDQIKMVGYTVLKMT